MGLLCCKAAESYDYTSCTDSSILSFTATCAIAAAVEESVLQQQSRSATTPIIDMSLGNVSNQNDCETARSHHRKGLLPLTKLLGCIGLITEHRSLGMLVGD
jgi:hypothetical protein